MSDKDSNYRLVAILNKRIETGKVMNALAHCTAGVVNLLDDEGMKALNFLNFVDADGQQYPSISARSFIILRGTDSEIRKTRQHALEAGLQAVCFSESMTGGSYVEQLERTQRTPTASLELYAIVLVGEDRLLSPLTKRYSLWRSGETSQNAAVQE
jgi:hypothetical protein